MSATILLTPLMLASATTTVDVPASQYTHGQQVQAGFQLAQYNTQTFLCTSTFTASGTQTFDFQGRPYDSDSDRDQSGDC